MMGVQIKALWHQQGRSESAEPLECCRFDEAFPFLHFPQRQIAFECDFLRRSMGKLRQTRSAPKLAPFLVADFIQV
jgi:hypothetical protein